MTALYRPPLSDADRAALASDARKGLILAIPTDTVYGLGTSGLAAEGVGRIYSLKGRKSAKPLPIFVHSQEEARRWTQWSSVALALARKHWPGPLTIVLHPTEEGRKLLSPGARTLAVRVPDHPLVLSLIEASGVPWAVTSANLSGRPELRDGYEVVSVFSGSIDGIVDAGKTPGGLSTVVDASEGELRLLREGAIRL